jgi:hypothetical protein
MELHGKIRHNFRAGEDHIVCCYDDTKSDQTGEKCTDKHIYANQLEPTVCLFLALAVFFSLESLHLSETKKLFILPFYHTGINQAGLQTRAKQLDSHESAHAAHKQLTYPSSQPSKVELLINLVTSMIY